MAVSIVQTSEEGIVCSQAREALREGVRSQGGAVLLVPTFAQAIDAQRVLAQERGLAMSVSTTTPAAWVRDRWEVWGDGRALADDVVLSVLARSVLVDSTDEERGPVRLSVGMVRLLSRLVNRALPWLPLDADGRAIRPACAKAGLTETETRVVGLAGKLGVLLARRGYVGKAEAGVRLCQALAMGGASLPAVVACGFSHMERTDRELLRSLGEATPVSLVARADERASGASLRELVGQLGGVWDKPEVLPPQAHPHRDACLQELCGALFGDAAAGRRGGDAVELLHATGPVAEAELVARRVSELVGECAGDKVPCVAIAVADGEGARRELVPKLVARGLSVRQQWTRALGDVPAIQGFLSFARIVAQLVELDASWPEPANGLEGPVPQLGDMSWWPPRELVDFLLGDLSNMPAARAWQLDAQWRGNRLLTPKDVLATLQSERDTSVPVARATSELLRGRVGSAASKLLAPFVSLGNARERVQADEAMASMQAILRIAGTLHDLGVTADPAVEGALPLRELVRLCEWGVMGSSMVERAALGEGSAQVIVTDTRGAAALGPCAVESLVLCGCTAAEQPLQTGDDLLRSLLERLGVEPPDNPIAQMRATLAELVRVPRRHLVFERALTNADGGEAYPSVMLTEVLSALGVGPGEDPAGAGVSVRRHAETDLVANRDVSGMLPPVVADDPPAPAGKLSPTVRELVFVPQNGSLKLPGDRPVLSVSQVETYLDCPLKWFSLRRLRLGGVDAGHTGMEMGTFAHRVLEKTHGELLVRALGEGDEPLGEAQIRELGEGSLTTSVPGSRVDATSLELARSTLELEFDLHQQHMYMVRKPRPSQQLLVAHNSMERAQEERLKQDLLSTLEYETRILQGFEPRLFEWSFGRGDELVEYAGAYFTGTVDRIDVSTHGTAVIIDYKHKSPVGFATEYDALQPGVLEGVRLPNRVQSLIYAQVVRRAFEGRLRLVGTVYLSTKSPHALAGAADENVADLLFGNLRAARIPSVCVPRTAQGESGMEDLLDRTEELVAEQVERMLAGNVEARPRDWHSCDFCPVAQCERRLMR